MKKRKILQSHMIFTFILINARGITGWFEWVEYDTSIAAEEGQSRASWKPNQGDREGDQTIGIKSRIKINLGPITTWSDCIHWNYQICLGSGGQDRQDSHQFGWNWAIKQG